MADISVNLTGLSATGQIGALSVGLSVGASGVACSGSVGNITPAVKTKHSNVAATGVAALFTIAEAIVVPDTYGTGAVEALSPSGSDEELASGVSAGGAAGTIGFAISGGGSPTGVDAVGSVGSLATNVIVGPQPSGVSAAGIVSSFFALITLPGVFATGAVGLATDSAYLPKVILLTTGASWTVPSDWNSANNAIVCIAGGGGGANGLDGAGGGGGGYASVSNLAFTPNTTISYSIGLGGAGGVAGTTASPGASGGNTWFGGTSFATSYANAHGGHGGTTSAGHGGSTTGDIGTTLFAGGSGGGNGSWSGGGGGGAAGPNGAGAKGGDGSYAGAGGGGDGGGIAGAASTNENPGAGGNNSSGIGSGAPGIYQTAPDGSAGTVGGGGGGGYGDKADTGLGDVFSPGTTFVGKFAGAGGAGGPGTEWGVQGGSGGGGGGGGSTTGSQTGMPGGPGGSYGGGGGAGGLAQGDNYGDAGGSGAPGAILITYASLTLNNAPLTGVAAAASIGSIAPDPSVPIVGGVSSTTVVGVIPELIESLGPDSVYASVVLGNLVYNEFGFLDGQGSNTAAANLSVISSNPKPVGVFSSGLIGSIIPGEFSSTLFSVYSTGVAGFAISAPLAIGVYGQGLSGNVIGVPNSSGAIGVFGLGGISALKTVSDLNIAVPGIAGSGFVGSLIPSLTIGSASVSSSGFVGVLSGTSAAPINGVHAVGALGAFVVSEFVSVLGVAGSGNVGAAVSAKFGQSVGVLSATAVGVFRAQIGAGSTGVQGIGVPGAFLVSEFVPAFGVAGSGNAGTAISVKYVQPIGVTSATAVGVFQKQVSATPAGTHAVGLPGAFVISEFVPALGVAGSGNVGAATSAKFGQPVGVLSATAVGVFQAQINTPPIVGVNGVGVAGNYSFRVFQSVSGVGVPGVISASPAATELGVAGTGGAGLDGVDVEGQGIGVGSGGRAGALTGGSTVTRVLGIFATGALGALSEVISGSGHAVGVDALGVLGSLGVSSTPVVHISGVASLGSVGFDLIAESVIGPAVYATGLAGGVVVPAPIFGVSGTAGVGFIRAQDLGVPPGVLATGAIGQIIVPTNVLPGGVSASGNSGSLTALFEAAYPGVFADGEAELLTLVRASLSGVSGDGASGLLLASSLYIPGASANGVAGQPFTLILPGTPIQAPPAPTTFVLPAAQSLANQFLPSSLFNNTIRNNGLRLGWMKSHACACTMSGNIPGAPNPSCKTCHGRGRWWEPPSQTFTGLLTFMHTMEASDEPGVTMDSRFGVMAHAEPTITIPSDVPLCWSMCSLFDAFVEQDALTRFETVLTVGGVEVLPYQQNLEILSVTAYDSVNKLIIPLGTSSYSVSAGRVSLIGFPVGTPYTVSYNASPVYVVWRRVGGLPHQRPFGAGTAALPARFRAMPLDLWTRARNGGLFSSSPEAL